MRLNGLLRRARRLKITSVWSALYQFIEPANNVKAAKHIKIDDEERRISQEKISTSHSPLMRLFRLLILTLLILILIALLIGYTIYKPPTYLIAKLQQTYPDVTFHLPLPAGQRIIALTIDDAPSSSTGEILNLLKAHNAKATFFIIGTQISEYASLIQRIHDEGHEIGNHAWADEPSWKLPISELERQVKDVEALIPVNEDGRKWFRPGWGWFSKEMVGKLREMGYRIVLASVFPHDPQIPFPKVNAKHVLSMVSPGAIVLMHDRRSYSAEQFRLVLEGLERGRWEVVTLGQLWKLHDEFEGTVESRYLD